LYDQGSKKMTNQFPNGDVIPGATISRTSGDQNIPVSAIEVGAGNFTSDPCAAGFIVTFAGGLRHSQPGAPANNPLLNPEENQRT
jgi:hypothetical protein